MRLLTIPRKRATPRPAPLRRSDQAGSIQRYYPSSSCIAAIVYDGESETAWVSFRDGASVELDGLSELEVYRWVNSASPGAYWNRYLRGRY
jgi:hypothetical protein